MAKNKDTAEQANVATAEAAAPAAEAAATEKKSIVPPKYANKYKGGGSDDVARFIKQECGEGDKFNFDSFFQLCRVNGIPDEQVNKYQEQVQSDAHGAKGRARMTLRNMLAAKARKAGTLKKQDGTDEPVDGGKVAVSGAAAKAQANAGTDEANTGSGEPASELATEDVDTSSSD